MNANEHTNRRMRAKIIVAATTMALCGAGLAAPASAYEPYPDPPRVLNASISSTDIDVVDGPKNVTVRVELEHPGTGLKKVAFDPQPDEYRGVDAVAGKEFALVSGDDQRGVYEATFTFPEGAEPGRWYFGGYVVDTAGVEYHEAEFSVGLYPVVHSIPDRTRPEVSGRLSKTLVDVTDKDASVRLDVIADDAGVGFHPQSMVPLEFDYIYNRGNLANISTNRSQALFSTELTFSKSEVRPGSTTTRHITLGPIPDANGNESYWSGNVTVATRPLQGKRPILDSTAQGLLATWATHIDPLGIEEYEVEFAGPVSTYVLRTTALEGLRSSLPQGSYTARVRARNTLGWGAWSARSTETYFNGPVQGTIPIVTGTSTVGSTLAAVPGRWSPTGVGLAYQWSAGGTPIPGATNNTLLLTPTLAGKSITVAVTGMKNGYTATTKTSTAVKVTMPAIKVVPTTPTSVASTGSYTIPSKTGVRYLVNGTAKAPGTYRSGYANIKVTAVAQQGYVLLGTAYWVLDLAKKNAVAAVPAVSYATKTITIPRVTGVAYFIDGIAKTAGKHRVTTNATVRAKAFAANYVVSAKAWKHDLRTSVTPIKPVFSSSANTVKIPTKSGVAYYVNGVKKSAGTRKYAGAGTVVAKASTGSYKLAGTVSWKFDNRNAVTPIKPVFSSSANTVKIPTKSGVAYYVNGVRKATGTHRDTGVITVIAKASNGSFRLTGTVKWSAKL
jgi:hypothetical protein